MGQIELEDWGGELRTVYLQLDGTTILADLCKCWEDPMKCPIDDHVVSYLAKQPQLF